MDRVRRLDVYQTAYEASMRVFRLSKTWPMDGPEALGVLVRNASRSICVKLARAWAKDRLPRGFVRELKDAHDKALETKALLEFAHENAYLDTEAFESLKGVYSDVADDLMRIMTSSERWPHPSERDQEGDQ